MRRHRVTLKMKHREYTATAHGLYAGFHKPFKNDPEMLKRVRIEIYERNHGKPNHSKKLIGVWRVKELKQHTDGISNCV